MTQNEFWQSPVYRIIKEMKATGNQTGVIANWRDQVEKWAERYRMLPEAKAIHAWLPMWQVRPFYSAAELSPMFPALSAMLGFGTIPTRSPARLAFELDYGGLPRLQNHRDYFAVERIHFWQGRDISDTEFAEAFHGKV